MIDDTDEMEPNFDKLYEIREKYGGIITNVALIIGILLVIFLGFIYGSAKVCDQVGGILDDKMFCHLDLPPNIYKDPKPNYELNWSGILGSNYNESIN